MYLVFKESFGDYLYVNKDFDSKKRMVEMFYVGILEFVKKYIFCNVF